MYSYRPPHMAEQKQDNQLEHTYSSYVRIWDVALKSCQRQWMIGRSGEKVSGISVLVARDDDNDESSGEQICILFESHKYNMVDLLSHMTQLEAKFKSWFCVNKYIYIYIYCCLYHGLMDIVVWNENAAVCMSSNLDSFRDGR